MGCVCSTLATLPLFEDRDAVRTFLDTLSPEAVEAESSAA